MGRDGLDSVCVLLSTYNGEQYLEEQLNSILNQNDIKVFLFVRDDGSSDKTIDILDKYAKKYVNFEYYQGENVGVINSFIDLLKKAPPSDYYAFSDQDDYWYEDKLKRAISQLKDDNNNYPNLYFSNQFVTDEKLNIIRKAREEKLYINNKYSCLVENFANGCTEVFNATALQYAIKKLDCDEITMHDAWLFMICSLMGNVYYDEEPSMLYRQHTNNVIGAGEETVYKFSIRDILLRIIDNNRKPRYNNSLALYHSFGNMLAENDLKKVLELVNYKKSFTNKIKLICDKDIKTGIGKIDLIFKTLVFLGKA